jgi:protein-S-isoprenylcysteine O-methyltransferase Ste14
MRSVVYACSFWHYLEYWRAYRYGVASPAAFRRRAVALKTLALAVLADAYLTTPWHWPSAVVITGGFLLSALAARALGPARTYYGAELGEVRPGQVTTFPYSLLSHPMLVGNLVAFGGTLLNPVFRHEWWPLASLHVACNAGLLLMETQLVSHGGRHPAEVL